MLASLKSFIQHYFAEQEKVASLDSRQECQNIVRSLCSTTPKGIYWRDSRSWLLIEDSSCPSGQNHKNENGLSHGEVILTGVVRGKSLKADRLVHLEHFGDFQIDRITRAPRVITRKGKIDYETMEENQTEVDLDKPSEAQDPLDELAPEDVLMDETETNRVSTAISERKGVLLDDEYYFSGDEDEEPREKKPKRVPRGTSKYQSAWYVDDVSDSDSDLEEVNYDANDTPMDEMDVTDSVGSSGVINGENSEPEPSEAPQTETFADRSPDDEADDIAAYRTKRGEEAKEDVPYPDEIELHPDVLARERLAKYRGLKSLKTSPWDATEDQPYQPAEWDQLLDIGNYKGAKNRVMHDALVGGVTPGTRVNVHLRNAPLDLLEGSRPWAAYSLLKHEKKRTAVNYSIQLKSEVEEPIRSKDELIVQCGPRRFVVNPLFSQLSTTPNDVHKFERYIHPGRTAAASFTAPLTWGNVPILWFKPAPSVQQTTDDMDAVDTSGDKQPSTNLQYLGHGTSLTPSTSRIIAKRVVLTGQPYRIHRRIVTIRYMFFNPEDVAWFKALPLWTKRGRQGAIKESLGTHGYYKAIFDQKIGMQDAIGVSLYKRMWPRPARPFITDI